MHQAYASAHAPQGRCAKLVSASLSAILHDAVAGSYIMKSEIRERVNSLVANSGSFIDLQPRPSAQFTINNIAYLLLIQNFSNKKRGLVMLNADKKGELVTTPVPVYDRYEYNVGLTQPGNDYFILPYSHKSETGLLKVTLSN